MLTANLCADHAQGRTVDRDNRPVHLPKGYPAEPTAFIKVNWGCGCVYMNRTETDIQLRILQMMCHRAGHPQGRRQ